MEGCVKKGILELGFTMLFLSSIVFLHPQLVFAETKICGDYEYQYNEDYNEIEIVRYSGEDKKVTVPETIEGFPVTVIKENAFCYCRKMKTIVLPEGLQEIGEGAFESCPKLKKITFQKNAQIVKIGKNAFRDCRNLTEVKFPASLKVLESCAFEYCLKLKKVEFANNSNLRGIGSYCFSGCQSLSGIIIPKKVVTIQSYAFYECSKLKKITFQGDIPRIEKAVFQKIYDKAVFQVPKKYKSSYQKKLKTKAWYQSTMSIRAGKGRK